MGHSSHSAGLVRGVTTYSVPGMAGITVDVVTTRAALAAYVESWQALAGDAIEPNVFHEPLCVLPALDALGAEVGMRFAFVMQEAGAGGSGERDGPRRAIGFFPMTAERRLRGLLFVHLASWQHPLLYLSTPLLHRDHADTAVRGLLRWTRTVGAEGRLLEWPWLHADGPASAAMRAAIKSEQAHVTIIDSFDRALLRPDGADAHAYVARAISPGARREWTRLRRRLAERGALEVRRLQPGEDALPWIDAFLTMEREGWKGPDGGALLGAPALASAFAATCVRAHAAGRLHFLGLYLGDTPVALQVNLLAGGAGFALKVAFDERFAKYSPGALLELDNIQDQLDRPGFCWMDSCTRANHPLMHRLWGERRTIRHLLIAPGRVDGRLVAALFPAAQAIVRRGRNLRPRRRAT